MPEADEPLDQFVERWNAWVDLVPEDQRIGSELNRLNWEMRDKVKAFESSSNSPYSVSTILSQAQPGNEYWEYAQEIYAEFAPELENARNLVARPWFATKLQKPMDFVFVGDDNQSVLRPARAWMIQKAVYHAHRKEYGESADSILGVLETVRLSSKMPGWSSWLGQQRNAVFAIRLMYLILDQSPDAFSDEQLAVFQSALLELVGQDITHFVSTEEYIAIQMLEYFYASTPDGNLHSSTSRFYFGLIEEEVFLEDLPWSSPLLILTEEDRKRTQFAPLIDQLAVLRELFLAIESDLDADPFLLRSSRLDEVLNQVENDEDLIEYLPVLANANASRIMLRLQRGRSIQVRSAVIVLGIHRYRLQTGGWPASLEELKQSAQKINLVDPSTGESFGYSIINNKPLLWSGGPDRDNDGGIAINPPPSFGKNESAFRSEVLWFTLDEWDALSLEQQSSYDGDWIHFPLSHEE